MGEIAHVILLRLLAILCLVVLVTLLTGCGEEPHNPDYEPWDGSYDFVTGAGIFVNHTGVKNIQPEDMERAADEHYQDVMDCTGIHIAAAHPFKRLVVHFDDPKKIPGSHLGYHIGDAFNDYVRVPESQAVYLTPWILRHEYVHVLLWRSGASTEMNTGHRSPLFNKCESILWRQQL